MNSTITDQMDQIEMLIGCAATDQIRLGGATFLLPASQATVSSGSQLTMRCDMRRTLERLYCAGMLCDNPTVKSPSPRRRGACEIQSTRWACTTVKGKYARSSSSR